MWVRGIYSSPAQDSNSLWVIGEPAVQGCGERGILHKDEEGGLRTQLLIQREEEEREGSYSRKLQGGGRAVSESG